MGKKLVAITTRRLIFQSPSFNTQYEWEDIISDKMGLKFHYLYKWSYNFFRCIEKSRLVPVYNIFVPKRRKLCLYFVMTARTYRFCFLDKNTIPVIIDFWLTEKELPKFYKAYAACPLVLVTSAEVYQFLKKNNCPLPLEHWPLSLPDNVEVRSEDKIYDFCFIGRKDPFFVEMIKRYAAEHNDFEYIINSDDIFNRDYYTNRGSLIARDTGRESYFNIIRHSKICVYSTPGIDRAKDVKGRFNQVTPRVMELLSGGCYVLGHYPDNADTDYYNLKSIVPQIKKYEDFVYYMDMYRNSPSRDIMECRTFIERNNTSSRIPILKEILQKRNITF